MDSEELRVKQKYLYDLIVEAMERTVPCKGHYFDIVDSLAKNINTQSYVNGLLEGFKLFISCGNAINCRIDLQNQSIIISNNFKCLEFNFNERKWELKKTLDEILEMC